MASSKALSNKDMNGLKVINLGAPSATTDAATKTYVDSGDTSAKSRANHTGTQTAATISDFDAAVRSSRLDQMAAPTALLNLNNQRITSLAAPSASTDAATKTYVDDALAGLASGQVMKGAVRVAATSNVNISAPGTSIDGVTLSNGDLVLLTAQTTGSQNGPYVFNGSGSAMTRASNWDTNGEASVGSYWVVGEGTRADQFALLTNDTAITLGTTVPAFTFISASTSIGRYAVDSPTVSAGGSWVVTHNLGSRDVTVDIRRAASPYDFVDVAVEATDTNTVTVKPDVSMASGEYRAIVKF